MTSLIEMPPDNHVRRKSTKRKSPGWLVVGLVGALALGLGLLLTFTASDDKNRADNAEATTLGLADQITQECASNRLPVYLCQNAEQARVDVKTVQGDPGLPGKPGEPGKPGDPGKPGEPGKDGANGADAPVVIPKDGVDGKDGKDGKDGRDGKDAELPTAYTKTYADGRTESCQLTPNTDPPNYKCTENPPEGTN